MTYADEAIAVLGKSRGPEDPELAKPWSTWAEALLALRRNDEAKTAVERALALLRASGIHDSTTVRCRRFEAEIAWREGDRERARTLASEALASLFDEAHDRDERGMLEQWRGEHGGGADDPG